MKLPAPGLPTDDLYSATVTLRAPPKGEDSDERGTVMIVYDDSSLDPQWCKQVLSEEFCCAFNADNHFISAATDVSVSHQAAGVFMARSQKKAEGVFYGLTSVPGFDGKLTLPSLYWSVADPSSDTSALRYPTSLNPSMRRSRPAASGFSKRTRPRAERAGGQPLGRWTSGFLHLKALEPPYNRPREAPLKIRRGWSRRL